MSPSIQNMGVDHRRAQIPVPEEFLDRSVPLATDAWASFQKAKRLRGACSAREGVRDFRNAKECAAGGLGTVTTPVPCLTPVKRA